MDGLTTVKPMQRYRSHKIVAAAKISTVGLRGAEEAAIYFEDKDLMMRIVSLKGKPEPHSGWYLVEYGNGYYSFSPAEAFEEGYTLLAANEAVAGQELGRGVGRAETVEDIFIEIEFRDEIPVARLIVEGFNRVLRDLHQIKMTEKRIMSALTDLQAADQLEAASLVTLGQAVTDVGTRVAALASTLNSDADVEAVAAELTAHASTMAQLGAALAAIAPAATVDTPVTNPIVAPDAAATT